MKTFAPKISQDDVKTFVSLRDRPADGHVEFFPMGGGPRYVVSATDFDDAFVEVPESALAGLLGKRSRTLVSLCGFEDFEQGYAVGCWTNGTKWNGFEQPSFTKADLEHAVAEGPLNRAKTTYGDGVFWSDRASTFVVVESSGPVAGDERIPSSADFETLVDRLLAGEEVYEVEFGGHLVSASLANKRQIKIGGEKVEVYDVGENWTWLPADEPSDEHEPTVFASP